MEARIAAGKGPPSGAQRRRGKQVSKECMDNPLARGGP